MQSAKDFLKVEADKKLAEATAIADAAEDRPMTIDERKSVEGLMSEAEQLQQRVTDIEENEKVRESIDKIRGAGQKSEPQQAPAAWSIGDAFVKSDVYNAMREGFKSGLITGNWNSGPVEIPEFIGGTKTNVTEALSPVVQPAFTGFAPPNAAVLQWRLTVADLLAQGTTDSNTVRYLQETTRTNAAAAVDEAGAKPESAITFLQVDEPVRKVATFLPVSDEMLEDVAQIRSYLDNRLRLFVQQAEETQLLSGSGTPPNIRGLLNRSGVQTGTRSVLGVATGETAGSTTIGNALYRAITLIRTNAFTEPDGIVMHPTNWSALRLQKDTAGQYLGGGPMIGAYGNGLMTTETAWGLPVVVTSAIAANTALVGAFGTMAQVFYRNGLTVEASNSHQDFFQKNLTAIRAEQRLALAVYRPEAFCSVTALQTP